jgi:hypothetical protein
MKQYILFISFPVIGMAGLDSHGLLGDWAAICEVAEHVCGWKCISQILGGGRGEYTPIPLLTMFFGLRKGNLTDSRR